MRRRDFLKAAMAGTLTAWAGTLSSALAGPFYSGGIVQCTGPANISRDHGCSRLYSDALQAQERFNKDKAIAVVIEMDLTHVSLNRDGSLGLGGVYRMKR